MHGPDLFLTPVAPSADRLLKASWSPPQRWVGLDKKGRATDAGAQSRPQRGQSPPWAGISLLPALGNRIIAILL